MMGVNYPSPFFDVAHTYLPTTVKALFRWCRYYFLTNPLINATVFKLSEYPVTDVLIDHENDEVKRLWEEFLYDQLRYQAFRVELGLDYHVYGNAFVGLSFPFHKHLTCTQCGFQEQARKIRDRWVFTNFNFRLNCPQCGNVGEALVKDFYIKDPSGIRLIRWNPENIEVSYNEISGQYNYFYTIPGPLRNDIVVGKKDVVESIPQIFIQALKQQKGIVFNKDMLFHLRRPTLATQDRGWGTPLLLPVLKDAFYLTIMKKSQESVLLEHILPLRVLFPQAGSGTSDPFTTVNLETWREHVSQEIARWRMDCVAPETLVETSDGLRQASEIVEGTLLKNHLGRWARVDKVWRRPLREGERAFRIIARGLSGAVGIVSEGHPFLAARKFNNGNGHKLGETAFIRAKDLRVGDYIGYPTERTRIKIARLDLAEFTDRVCTEEWVYVDYTSPEVPHAYEYLLNHEFNGDRKALLDTYGWSVNHFKTAQIAIYDGRTLRRLPRYTLFDEELAWVVGLYAAEGSATHKQVLFALHKDEVAFEARLRQFFLSRFGAEGFVAARGENGIQVYFSSVIAAQVFHTLCPGTASTKRLHSVFRACEDHIAAQLVRGIIDGDGCYHEDGVSKKVTWASASRQLIEDVRQLLLSVGIPSGLSITKPGTYLIEGRFGTTHGSYRLGLHGPSRDRLLAWFNAEPMPTLTGTHIGVFRDGYFWHRIREIHQVEVEEVIGFQMDQAEGSVRLADDTETHGTFCLWGAASANTNYIPILPLPIGQETIGGDGRALLLVNEMQVVSEQLLNGMMVPLEFIKGGLCLAEDSLVFTSAGLEELSEITPSSPGTQSIDRVVQTHEGLRRASQGHNVGEKTATRVLTRLGLELVAAPTHPLLVLRKDLSQAFVPIEDLQPGDFVAVKTGAELWPTKPFTFEVRLEKVGGRYTRADLDDVQLPEVMTPELARLMGYLIAEGSCSSARRMSFSNTDEGLVDDFVSCFKHVFGYTLSRQTRTANNSKIIYVVEISRQLVVEFLQQAGINGYAADKRVPISVRKSPKDCVVNFLRAYFDGDGGVENRRQKQGVFAVSKSRKLLQEIQLLLLNMGIVSTLYPTYNNRPVYSLSIRSVYVDRFAAHVGFISRTKNAVLARRSPARVAGTCADRVPYVREALMSVRDKHTRGICCWHREPVDVPLTQDKYTLKEIAALVDRDSSSINLYVKSGALKATKVPQEGGHFAKYVVSRDHLRDFFRNHGLGKRRTFGIGQWEMSYERLACFDLNNVRDLDAHLAANIEKILEQGFVWDEVTSIEDLGVQLPMRDLGVAEVHSYQANGVICHNSYAGTNVSMRMMENMFIGYNLSHKHLLRFVIEKIAAFLDWPVVKGRFKPFKMADDLQRLALMFQANSAGKISDTTFLGQIDLSQTEEAKIRIKEAATKLESTEKEQLAMAEIQGKSQLIMMKYQTKAQMASQQEMTAPQAPGEPGGPEALQAGTPGGQPMGPGQGAAAMVQGGAVPADAQSPIGAEQNMQQTGPQMDLQSWAMVQAQMLAQIPESQRQMALQNLQSQNPQLADLVRQLLRQITGSQGAAAPQADMRPLPDKLPPRRAAQIV
jgi:intein/homing endonuclease